MTYFDAPTREEAARDAWEAGEHACQTGGHSFPRSRETNEPLRCSGCGLDPDLYEEEAEAEALTWVESPSADEEHEDQEVTLNGLGGAVWAGVANQDIHWTWGVYSRWLWEDIDADPAATLAEGTVATQAEAKAAVEAWVREAGL